MNKNEIFKNGILLEYTTEEIIDNTIYYKHYDAQDNLLNEWTKEAPTPEKTKIETELLQEKIDMQDGAIMELAQMLGEVMV